VNLGTGDEVLTTGQVAKIMSCATRTVTNLIDNGKLPGFRIPGSTHRRVLKSDLISFMKNNGMENLIDEHSLRMPEQGNKEPSSGATT
jgi:excisionase family DNA binding protein